MWRSDPSYSSESSRLHPVVYFLLSDHADYQFTNSPQFGSKLTLKEKSLSYQKICCQLEELNQCSFFFSPLFSYSSKRPMKIFFIQVFLYCNFIEQNLKYKDCRTLHSFLSLPILVTHTKSECDFGPSQAGCDH